MEAHQLSMFDEIDPILEKFNIQLDLIIIRYRLNTVWRSQNRMEYTLYSTNGELTVQCTLNHIIARSLSISWNKVRIDEWLYTLNPKLGICIKERANFFTISSDEERRLLEKELEGATHADKE